MMSYFIVFLVLIFSPLWAFAPLSEDPSCIPGVIHALNRHLKQPLKKGVIEEVQRSYRAFTSGTYSEINARPLLRLMAALRVSDDSQANKLYLLLNKQRYQKNSSIYKELQQPDVGYKLNKTEQNIAARLRADFATHQTMQAAYLARLVPVLGRYWRQEQRQNDERHIRALPSHWWPQSMCECIVHNYVQKSKLKLALSPGILVVGVLNIIKRHGAYWLQPAQSAEHFFCQIVKDLEWVENRNQLWLSLCEAPSLPQDQSFARWTNQTSRDLGLDEYNQQIFAAKVAEVFGGGIPPQDFINLIYAFAQSIDLYHRGRALNSLAEVWLLLGGHPSGDFAAWVEPLLQGLDPYEESILKPLFAEVWKRYSGPPTKNFMREFHRITRGWEAYDKAHALNSFSEIYKLFGRNQLRKFACYFHLFEASYKTCGMSRLLGPLTKVWIMFQGNPPPELIDQYQWLVHHEKEMLKKFISSIPTDWIQRSATQRQNFIRNFERITQEQIMPTRLASLLLSLTELWPKNGLLEKQKLVDWRRALLHEDDYLQDFFLEFWMSTLGPFQQSFLRWSKNLVGSMRFCQRHLFKNPSTLEMVDSVSQSCLMEWIHGLAKDGKVKSDRLNLISIWRSGLNEDYQAYRRHLSISRREPSDSYCSRSYLYLLRAQAAFRSEQNNEARHDKIVEKAKAGAILPPINNDDPYVVALMAQQDEAADTHNFDHLYLDEYQLLVSQTGDMVLNPADQSIDIHNDKDVKKHTTNNEVMDFLNYLKGDFLETSSPREQSNQEKALVICQILGVESSSSVFGSYLGNKMLYGHAQTIEADDVLGRVWAFMKKIAKERGLAKYHKIMKEEAVLTKGRGKAIEEARQAQICEQNAILRSVPLAIYGAAESSHLKTNTHCQTRTTAELMKAICYYLPESMLKPLVVSLEDPDANPIDNTTIAGQIADAPNIASRLFTEIQQNGKNMRALFGIDTDPELWRIYKAFYDDFYVRSFGTLVLKNKKTGEVLMRTTYENYAKATVDPIFQDMDLMVEFEGLQQDEHLLVRDMNTGDLVYAHPAAVPAGAAAAAAEVPRIKYAQAPFTAIEYEFFKLLKKNYEDKRGRDY